MEPWFEEGNGFETPFGTWYRIVGTNPAKRVIGGIESPGKVAGGDIETREVADEHREGRRMNVDVPQCQTCHIVGGRAKGVKHRRYAVSSH